MKINLDNQKIKYEDIKIGDVLITAIGTAWLVVCDSDYDYIPVNLTDSSIGYPGTYFETIHGLYDYIEDREESKIIKHILGDKLKLSLLEG